MIEKLRYGDSVSTRTDKVNDMMDVVSRLVDMVNIHEKQIDELQMKIDPEKCDYEDEKDWIGKLCKFRDGGYAPWQYGILTDITPEVEFPYWMRDIEFAECQPVLEEEFKDVIYKKGQK